MILLVAEEGGEMALLCWGRVETSTGADWRVAVS